MLAMHARAQQQSQLKPACAHERQLSHAFSLSGEDAQHAGTFERAGGGWVEEGAAYMCSGYPQHAVNGAQVLQRFRPSELALHERRELVQAGNAAAMSLACCIG